MQRIFPCRCSVPFETRETRLGHIDETRGAHPFRVTQEKERLIEKCGGGMD